MGSKFAAYNKLETIFKEKNTLEEILAILHWDAAVIMPKGGAESRSEHIATLHQLIHQTLQKKELHDLFLEAKEEIDLLNVWQKANWHEMHRLWQHAISIPKDLVYAQSKANTRCEMIWREARANNDWNSLLPYITEVVSLTRNVALAKSELLKITPYDALLDQYDPGRRSTEIDPLFKELNAFLPDFIPIAQENSRQRPSLSNQYFDINKQKQIGIRIMKMLGFSFENGRLDESHHPFCGGIPSDIRMTTRYQSDNFINALMGIIHETGHGIYEANLPVEWRKLPVGQARGMSIHESQSLFMEMQIGLSDAFLKSIFPWIKEELLTPSINWNIDHFISYARSVSPSLIRVDADEVTYPAHILLRYELEKSLIEQKIEVRDIPSYWHESMKRLLGIEVSSDKDGCMQDIHWYGGDFGYFPTYSLGAITAAQLRFSMEKSVTGFWSLVENREYGPIISWLKTHIHELGSVFSCNELLIHSTKEPLNIKYYFDHLKERYLR
jgi:carboxypeptidase Taq